jgi:ComF family protein
VRGFKYRSWTGLAEYMSELMLGPAQRLVNGSVPELVPVPLTKARQRERGYNQAELLARALSRRSGWPIAQHLSRDRGGPSLARLGRSDRERIARNAYSVRLRPAGVGGSRTAVLIVDDVITTGATGMACAEALDAVGLECLGIVSFARTDPLVQGG